MRVAVIGYGSAGSRHARLLAARGLEVVVSDPNGERCLAAESDGHRTAEFDAALGSAQAAVIASPNHLHRGHLEGALAAGCDVLVETPIAIGAEGMDAILEDARREGRVVGVACNLRFVAAIEEARALVERGALGRVLRARADFGYDLRAWRPGRDFREAYSARPEQGGGVLLDAIHEFDYLYWCLGEVRRVACVAGSRSSLDLEVEDVAAAILDFAGGAVGEVALDYASGVYRRGFELVGEDGTATWRWDEPAVCLLTPNTTTHIPVAPVGDMYERLIDDFIAALEERRDPRTSGEEGVAVLRVVEAALASARRGVFAEPGVDA